MYADVYICTHSYTSIYTPLYVHTPSLLDLLFRFCTSWCFRIIPSLFWRDMHRALSLPSSAPLPKSAHYSPLLHNALLALATAYSDDAHIHALEFRRHFARRAKGYVERDCLSPSVCLVTGLSLLSTFHSSRGEQSLGYLYAGECILCEVDVQVYGS